MSAKEKLIASAQKFIAKGQFSRAVNDYRRLVQLDPKDIRHRQKLAELYSRAQMTSEAIEAFEGVARHYSENGFFLKAIAVYKQMQRLDPEEISISLRLAELNQKQGLTGNALAEYRVLVSAYEKGRNLKEAVKILQKMKDLEPENLNIRIKVIETYIQSSAPDKALSEFAEAVAILEAKQDNTRLLKLYEYFLPHFPNEPEMKVGQARILISKGESSRAISLLTGLVKEKPKDVGLLRNLAEGYRQVGDFTREIETYHRLLLNDSTDLKLRTGLLRALLDGGEAAAALKELDEWKDTFLEAGQIKPLKGFYERLRTDIPEEESVIESLRAIYELTGEGDKLFDMISASSKTPLEFNAEEEAAVADSAYSRPVEKLELESCPVFAPEQSEGAEEIPLEFLEDFGASSAVAEPAATETEEKVSELEFEMELDLGFDFLEPRIAEGIVEGTASSGGEEEAILPETKVFDKLDGGDGGGDFFDLRSALDDDEEESVTSLLSSAEQSPTKKKGIKTDIEVDDPDTHYNLGIAYKEMGLLDEAVCEFDKALREPSLTVACLSLKGMCLVEMEAPEDAEESFKQALATPELDEEVRMGLLYELGLLYEGWSRPADALENYRVAAGIDPSFRKVGEKIKQLDHEAAGREGAGEVRKRNRISYV